ncbi:dihydropteroate synthase [Candidatus Peregrinibacteria bacterium]|nr:dihydropteroate synthase [Candidatus Peregrinibacteria bacterium]
MGVLNLTPDSFSDGGRFFDKHKAVARFEQMIAEGADIIDLGAESTGPGSKEVSQDEESARIIPVIKTVRKLSDIWISIDTYKSEVAEMALKAGADMVNDVLALRGDNRMAEVISKHNVPVVLMYSKDATGRTTGAKKEYKDVIGYINNFFEERIKFAQSSGIKKEQIILDPGQGAFVSGEPKYSFQILKRLKEFSDFKLPILIGPSRKSFIGLTLNLPLHERLEGSLACAAVALMNGAKIIRAHDVKATRRVVDMVHAIISS